jgi:hypothetical protein
MNIAKPNITVEWDAPQAALRLALRPSLLRYAANDALPPH